MERGGHHRTPPPPPGPNEKQNPQKRVRFQLEQEVEKNIQGGKMGCREIMSFRWHKGQILDVEKGWKMASNIEYVRKRIHRKGSNLGVLSFYNA